MQRCEIHSDTGERQASNHTYINQHTVAPDRSIHFRSCCTLLFPIRLTLLLCVLLFFVPLFLCSLPPRESNTHWADQTETTETQTTVKTAAQHREHTHRERYGVHIPAHTHLHLYSNRFLSCAWLFRLLCGLFRVGEMKPTPEGVERPLTHTTKPSQTTDKKLKPNLFSCLTSICRCFLSFVSHHRSSKLQSD